MKKKAQELALSVTVIAVIVLAVVGFLYFLMAYDMVEPSHRGVKVRFGKILGIQHPSLQHTGLFTHVYHYDMRTRKIEIDLVGDNSAVDRDGQMIKAKINVNYRIQDSDETVWKLYENVGTDKIIAERLNIPEIITEGFKQATVKFEALDIVDKRQEVKELAKLNIHNNFPKQYFEIENIVITNIDWSAEFKTEIEAKKVAEQEKLKEENMLEVVIFQQQQKIEEAKAEGERIRLQSVALTELTLKQKMLTEWNGVLPMYLIITDNSQGMFLQLAKGDLNIAQGDAE